MATVSLKKLTKRYGTIADRARHRPRRRRPRIHRAGRPVRLRQVDDPAHDRRAGGDQRRRRCEIGGRVVNDLPPRSRNISMVFQSYALYPHMTVRENMGFSLKIAGRPQGRDGAPRRRGLGDPRPRYAAWSGGRRNCPAASASASPWAAPSCATPTCSCSTSRSPISTPSCARRCAPRSRSCMPRCSRP